MGDLDVLSWPPGVAWEDVEAATEGRLVRSERSGKPDAGPAGEAPTTPFDEEQGELVAESDWKGD